MEKKTRLPAVAGGFYPKEKESLKAQVKSFLENAKEFHLKPRAIIVPHAGYVYSGQVAGTAWKTVSGLKETKNAVIVGPSHFMEFEGNALSTADYWETPLGKTKVNREYFEIESTSMTEFDDAHEHEHSVEVQLPFLQSVLPKARIVPIATGTVEPKQLAEDLDSALGKNDLLVISTDLSHYLPYAQAKLEDQKTNGAITKLDFNAMLECEACGKIGVLALIGLAKKREWKPKFLDYANSGDTAGDKKGVVGYAAHAFI